MCQKCIYPKCIFAKCTPLACLLSFASFFFIFRFPSWSPAMCGPSAETSTSSEDHLSWRRGRRRRRRRRRSMWSLFRWTCTRRPRWGGDCICISFLLYLYLSCICIWTIFVFELYLYLNCICNCIWDEGGEEAQYILNIGYIEVFQEKANTKTFFVQITWNHHRSDTNYPFWY